jgi:hypothetical protein
MLFYSECNLRTAPQQRRKERGACRVVSTSDVTATFVRYKQTHHSGREQTDYAVRNSSCGTERTSRHTAVIATEICCPVQFFLSVSVLCLQHTRCREVAGVCNASNWLSYQLLLLPVMSTLLRNLHEQMIISVGSECFFVPFLIDHCSMPVTVVHSGVNQFTGRDAAFPVNHHMTEHNSFFGRILKIRS